MSSSLEVQISSHAEQKWDEVSLDMRATVVEMAFEYDCDEEFIVEVAGRPYSLLPFSVQEVFLDELFQNAVPLSEC